MPATLYATHDQSAYFLIPDEVTLPQGPLVLRSLTGRRLEIEAGSAAAYGIPEAEAKKMAEELVAGFAERLKGVAMSAARSLATARPLDPAEVADRERRVAESLRLGREQLREDPLALKAAIKGVFEGILSAAKESIHAPETARDKMKDVAEALRQEGVTEGAPELVEGLPDRLREVLGSPQTLAALDELTQTLEKATADLKAELARARKAEPAS